MSHKQATLLAHSRSSQVPFNCLPLPHRKEWIHIQGEAGICTIILETPTEHIPQTPETSSPVTT